MKTSATFLGVIMLCSAAMSLAQLAGDVREEWVRNYTGTAPSQDVAVDMIMDQSGNVYVTGYSSNLSDGLDYLTIKYNSSGAKLWEARYNGSGNGDDFAAALAVDASGNVYVTGKSWSGVSYDYLTVKYSSSGTQQWTADYNSPQGLADEATAIAVDDLGNVYVTGTSPGIGTLGDYATIKYDANGAEQWVQRYNGPGIGLDKAVAIFVEPSARGGNVYVTGESAGFSTGSDYATIKYSPPGVQQWVARYDGGVNGTDIATSIAVDNSGQVFVTGKSRGPGSSYSDYVTIRYNASGVEQWVERYDGYGRDDEAAAIALDNIGNVYVTGRSDSSGYDDYATVKYNAAGTQQWVARYRGVANFRNDEARALAVDNAGNVYVTGESGDNNGYDDFATIKYNSAGVQQWIARYAGTGSDAALAIAVDASGNVIVAGTSSGDYATVKYDASGTQQWVERYDGPGNANSEAVALAIHNAGNIFVAGKSQGLTTGFDYATLGYNSFGSELWPPARYHRGGTAVDEPSAVTVDGAGNIYVTGTSSNDFITVKYNSTGVEQWVAPYNFGGLDEAKAIAVDASGNVYVTGRSSNDYVTLKYNSSGVPQWAARYNGDGNSTDEATAIALDALGNIYVTGYSYGGSNTNYDYATIKYNSAGVEQWVRRYNGTGNGSDSPTALFVDAAGNVYVTGTVRNSASSDDYGTIKYSSSGVKQWEAFYNGVTLSSSDQATAIAVDAAGNVFVTGESGADYATVKYDAAGTRLWAARYAGPVYYDRATALALDLSGDVYVTGRSDGPNSDDDYFTVKYNTSGVEQWSARHNGAANGIDEARDIALDALGNVYVTGVSKGSGWSMFTTIKYSQNQNVGRILAVLDTCADPGARIKIPVRINDAASIAGAEITLNYDDNILTADSAQTTALTSGFALDDTVSPGKIVLVLARANGIVSGSGDFVNVNFRVNPSAASGTLTTIVFQHLKLSDDNQNLIPASGVPGSFTVTCVTPPPDTFLTVAPSLLFAELDNSYQFTATGRDSAGNPVPVNPSWRVEGGIGSPSPLRGATVTFKATNFGDNGLLIAEQNATKVAKDTAYVTVGLLGDITKDRLVDVRDVILCLQFAVKRRTPQSPYEFWAADCVENDTIDVADAYRIILKVLGRLLPKTTSIANAEEAVIRMPQLTGSAGETVTLPIFIEGRNDVYAADFDLTYDSTVLTVLAIEQGAANSLVAENLDKPDKIKLALINADGLVNAQSEIAKLKIRIEKELADATPLTLEHAKLYDASAKPIKLRAIYTNVAEEKTLPKAFALFQNHPNPFNPETQIRFQLPGESHVKLTIYNISGQLVRTLVNKQMSAGAWTETWDGRNEQGNQVPSGVYLYRLEAEHGQWTRTKKMILIR